MAIKMLKFAMNLTDDGMVGQQVLQVKPRDWPI
jgi:1,4-dihydroxy-2-naphthoyl-CoA synthase